ncbi:unnamed protein product [Closterium sp. NIES-64]|nr:unnamed protein product [Closterium sp. NIES-64]
MRVGTVWPGGALCAAVAGAKPIHGGRLLRRLKIGANQYMVGWLLRCPLVSSLRPLQIPQATAVQPVGGTLYAAVAARNATSYCKLWASDQNPCEARGWVLLGRAAHFAQRWLVRNQYVVGGYCRVVETLEEKRRKRNAPPPPPATTGGGGGVEADGRGRWCLFLFPFLLLAPTHSLAVQTNKCPKLTCNMLSLYPTVLPTPLPVQTNECPKLTCNTVTRGYMFDHEGKGHFNFTYTGIGPARPHTCYLLCRRTPGCAFWMYNMRSKRGACKMWTREQNPCEPTDAFDSTTAHYVAKRPTGSFVIGGNCDKLPPMKADPQAREAQMAQQQLQQ